MSNAPRPFVGYRGRVNRDSLMQQQQHRRHFSPPPSPGFLSHQFDGLSITAANSTASREIKKTPPRCLSAPASTEDWPVSLTNSGDGRRSPQAITVRSAAAYPVAANNADQAGNTAQRCFLPDYQGASPSSSASSRPPARSAAANQRYPHTRVVSRFASSQRGRFHSHQQHFGNGSSSSNWRNRNDSVQSTGEASTVPALPNPLTTAFSRGRRYQSRPPRFGPRGRGHCNNSNSNSSSSLISDGIHSSDIQTAAEFSLTPVNRFKDARTPPQNWAIYCFEDGQSTSEDTASSDAQLKTFTERMINEARLNGVVFGPPKQVQTVLVSRLDELEHFFGQLKSQHLDLVFIGISDSYRNIPDREAVYQLIKSKLDNEQGIISCCFQAAHVRRTPPTYFRHFLLKVNVKLGGVNQVFEAGAYLEKHLFASGKETNSQVEGKEAIMFVGVVHHKFSASASGADGSEHCLEASVCAAIGSRDPAHFAVYSSAVRVQPPLDCLVLHVDSMVRELLAEYRADNGGHYPDHLVLFRDGLCRQNFAPLRQNEVAHVERMLAKLVQQQQQQQPQKPIRLTVIVVQKRSSPDFSSANNGSQESEVPASVINRRRRQTFPTEVVLDEAVTDDDGDVFHLATRDFFIRTETATATRFVVLSADEDGTTSGRNFSLEQLKRLSFVACQNYARSLQPLDIPTCIRYADLCAGRAKLVAQECYRQMMIRGWAGRPQQSAQCIISQLNEKVQVERAVARTLYYC